MEHVISATDSETRPSVSVTLEEIDEVLDQVAAASPLHGAAGNGHEAVMSLLLENGADIEMKEIDGGTTLAVAIDNGSACEGCQSGLLVLDHCE